MGERGSVAFTRGEVLRQEAFRVRAHDYTGAGDAFDAGFIYGALMRLDLRMTLKIVFHRYSINILVTVIPR